MANYNYSQFPTAPATTSLASTSYLNVPTGTPVSYNPIPSVTDSQQYFPQPQGAVYMIRTSSDVNNIPITNGLSASICLTDGTLFIKTMQNGNPSMIGYKLIPLDNQISTNQSNQTQATLPVDQTSKENIEEKLTKVLSTFEDRLNDLEKRLTNKKGDGKEWQL